jgi:hypothetical protein
MGPPATRREGKGEGASHTPAAPKGNLPLKEGAMMTLKVGSERLSKESRFSIYNLFIYNFAKNFL